VTAGDPSLRAAAPREPPDDDGTRGKDDGTRDEDGRCRGRGGRSRGLDEGTRDKDDDGTPRSSEPFATDPEHAPDRAGATRDLAELDALVITCRACPRLVAWREEVGRVKRAAFRDQEYWARPVPGFGDPDARILVVGLAPAAHGGNRTGRMFTGDRSGDVLFASLHRTGFASQSRSTHRGDGLTLTGVRITAPVRCAPPANVPTPGERRRCSPYLLRELELAGPDVVVALGALAWQAVLSGLGEQGWHVPRPRPAFAHGAVTAVEGPQGLSLHLLGCYHVSQQNTFTGRLTPAMLDAVFLRARELAGQEARTSADDDDPGESQSRSVPSNSSIAPTNPPSPIPGGGGIGSPSRNRSTTRGSM
jgi:uracil-DNA glycosylase family 4